MMKILHFIINARQTLLLTWKLLWDPKVPGTLKLLLPVLAIIYWLSPIDLIPFLPFDDLVVVGLALKLFVELAQPKSASQTTGGDYAFDLDEDSIPTTWRVLEDEDDEPTV